MSSNAPLVGRLDRVPIRALFPKEASSFTTYLEENIDYFAEQVGLKLSVVQREKLVGDFHLDLLCEDENERAVIIENQLEPTDHDHLGKLLTYMVNLNASTAIWVTSQPRAEHQRVIDWLNESTPRDISFYLIRVEAVQIGNSPAAPLFTVVAAPSAEIKTAGQEKRDWAERHERRFKFWTALLERSKGRTNLFSNVSPCRDNWISTGAGKSGVQFLYRVLSDSATAELYIDHDKDTGAKNKAIFDALFEQKDEIEKEAGGPLDWQRLDARRSCRIIRQITGAGWASSEEKWPELQDKMIEAMMRLDKALRSRLAKIQV